MTLDSSALIAILFAEPKYLDLVDRILDASHIRGRADAGRNQPPLQRPAWTSRRGIG